MRNAIYLAPHIANRIMKLIDADEALELVNRVAAIGVRKEEEISHA